jgi:hypothetical protein
MERLSPFWLSVFVCLLVVGLLYGLFHLLPPAPTPGVTPENFRRIKRGMTHQQIRDILGAPGTFGPRYTFNYERSWTGANHSVTLRFQGGGEESDEVFEGTLTDLRTGETEDLPRDLLLELIR